MYYHANGLARQLAITRDDVVRLFTKGVIERPKRGEKGMNIWVIEDCPKLAELLTLSPDELKARGIINTSQLFKGAN